jgi:hypothetical protein
MFSVSSEGRGQYGAADRRVGETAEEFIDRSLEEGHRPAAVLYPQETDQG